MMRIPDSMPMHLMLAMMQSGIWPNASTPWNVQSWNFDNPFMPRLKTPLEKGVEQVQSLWQNQNEQWQKMAEQFASQQSQFLANLNPLQNVPSQKQSQNEDNNAVFTDYLPHFMQPEFLQALSEKAYANSAGFMEGMASYLASDYEPPEKEYDVLWERGSAMLLDLAPEATDAVAVLCVPSLINRSSILDLYPERSFAEYLKSRGFRPLILDWGEPGEEESDFATADYIQAYALDALQHLRANHDGPIALLGYCMGGIFTVAMAQLASQFVDALILLATPWDFSAEDTPRVLLDGATQVMLRQWIATQNPVAPVVTQTMFHMIDPWRVQEKFSRYPSLSDTEKTHFLAVEQWVNDGVPLARRVAEECFVDWPHGNILANHQWKVGRRWIEPASITCPTLAIIPTKDLIVPQGCALPLTNEIPRCDVLMPEAGHVSMLVGRNAERVLWKPLVKWLAEKF